MKQHEMSLAHFTDLFYAPEGIENMIPGLPEGAPLRGERLLWETDDEGRFQRVAIFFVPAGPGACVQIADGPEKGTA